MIQSNKIFAPMYTTQKRYILLTGGRGGMKSFEVSTFLALLTYELGQRIFFTRYTMTSAHKSIIPEFKDKLERLEIEQCFKINRSEITNLVTGNEIVFTGIKSSSGKQTAKMKGNAPTTFVIDEAEEFTEEDVFNTVDLSIRTFGVQNTVIMIMNPSDKHHFIYRRFIQNTHEIKFINGVPVEISTHPDVLHIHTTYLDNLHNLNQSFVSQMEALKRDNETYYNHVALGQWLDIGEGSLFQVLKTYKHSELISNDGITLAFVDVADTGKDYLCCVIAKIIGLSIYVIDVVFSQSGSDITLPQCAVLLQKYGARYCQVESNAMGAMYANELQKLVKDTQILRKNEVANKHTRIISDSFYIANNFYFKDESERSAQYQGYFNQLKNYTKDGKAKFDDAPDASSGLWRFIRSQIAGFA